jgi:outer membrane assembly lipoprotein YfiO
MVENILYLGGTATRRASNSTARPPGGRSSPSSSSILLFGFAHPLFTSMTGVGLGIAARTADRRVRILAPIAGLLVAMMLHGAWNLLPSLAAATGQPLVAIYGYIGVMVPIFFGMVGLALWLRAWEGRLTERTLPDYVRAGWLTPPEVAALGSLGRRHAARSWARRVGGDAGLKAMRGYQFAATRLALLRDGTRRGLDSRPADRERAAREERELLDAISAYREYIQNHRNDRDIEYAKYRMAKALYLDIDDTVLLPPAEERDQATTLDAFKELRGFIRQFPRSRYQRDAAFMLEVVTGRLVRHELYVARFYLKRDNFEATVARVDYALRNYPDSGLDPEALVLKGETLLKMKKPAEARVMFEAVIRDWGGPFTTTAQRFLDEMAAQGKGGAAPEGGAKPGSPGQGRARRHRRRAA